MPWLLRPGKVFALLFALWVTPVAASHLEPFSAEYKFYYADWELGTSSYSLQRLGEGHYLFLFKSALKILVFTDYREVKSEFFEKKHRLYPLQYRHARSGTGIDYVDLIRFDEKAGKITSTMGGDTVDIPYDAQLLDGLVMQLQLMLDVQQSTKQYDYSVVEANAVESISFTEKASETVTIEGKPYECVLVEAQRKGGRFKTYIWFARNLGFLPVQLAHYVNGKKQFNARITSYKNAG